MAKRFHEGLIAESSEDNRQPVGDRVVKLSRPGSIGTHKLPDKLEGTDAQYAKLVANVKKHVQPEKI